MAAITRFGPLLTRSVVFNPTRQMATATASTDPVQKLFVDKIREFKSSNQGLDQAHQKAMQEEMARLKRVYKVDDEAKLANLEYKFSSEADIDLHDIDSAKEKRRSIASGEFQKQLSAATKEPSDVLAAIPDQTQLDLHLPPMNKPDFTCILNNEGPPRPIKILDEQEPDYHFVGEKMTPHRLQRDMRVMFGPDMPTIHDDKKPGRDVVNFPRIPQPDHPPPTRYHVIPESWFRFFYPKTGVTGPYAFGGSFLTFLLSKEWLVWEHELLTGCTTALIFTYAVIKFGPNITGWSTRRIDEQIKGWEEWRLGNIRSLEKIQEHYKNELTKSGTLDDLYAVRQADIDNQLEQEYRMRLKTVYEDTVRRLNYLVSVADSQRQIAHKNMVNWVISKAIGSIGQKQESEVLDSCISNLKQLGSKNANAI